jgi:hypothetical protein
MKQLIEDYKRRLGTVEGIQKTFKSNGSVNDTKKEERLTTKASEYHTFIAELEREQREQNAENPLRQIILRELRKIKEAEEGFRTDYWGMVYFAENHKGAQPIHMSVLDFEILDDEDLVRCYVYTNNMRNSISERRVRQYYYGEK